MGERDHLNRELYISCLVSDPSVTRDNMSLIFHFDTKREWYGSTSFLFISIIISYHSLSRKIQQATPGAATYAVMLTCMLAMQ